MFSESSRDGKIQKPLLLPLKKMRKLNRTWVEWEACNSPVPSGKLLNRQEKWKFASEIRFVSPHKVKSLKWIFMDYFSVAVATWIQTFFSVQWVQLQVQSRGRCCGGGDENTWSFIKCPLSLLKTRKQTKQQNLKLCIINSWELLNQKKRCKEWLCFVML